MAAGMEYTNQQDLQIPMLDKVLSENRIIMPKTAEYYGSGEAYSNAI